MLLQNNHELYEHFFSPGLKIPMGRYRPDSHPEIKSNWFILERKDKNVLLILNDGAYPWHKSKMRGPNWEMSGTRSELNTSMYKDMFSDSERAAIQLTTLKNTVHSDNRVVEGNNTDDYIFLLSKEEVEYYQKVLPPEKMESDGWRSYGNWWTRSVASSEDVANNNFGRVEDCKGYMLFTGDDGIFWADRPDDETISNSQKELLPCMRVDIDLLIKSWL